MEDQGTSPGQTGGSYMRGSLIVCGGPEEIGLEGGDV